MKNAFASMAAVPVNLAILIRKEREMLELFWVYLTISILVGYNELKKDGFKYFTYDRDKDGRVQEGTKWERKYLFINDNPLEEYQIPKAKPKTKTKLQADKKPAPKKPATKKPAPKKPKKK